MVTFTFVLSKASFSSSVTSTSSSNSSKKSSHVFLLPIFFNALLIKVFSTFPVFDSTNTLTHHVVSIVVIAFRYGFASMTFDEVIRNSKGIPNWNWRNNFLSFPERNRQNFRNNFFFFAEVNKIFPAGRFHRVGWKRGNKQYFNFDLIFSSETAWPNQLKLGWKNPRNVLYTDYSFSLDSLSNMAATDNSCFWLDEFLKSSLKSLGQMNWDLVGNISVMSSIKIAHFVPIR